MKLARPILIAVVLVGAVLVVFPFATGMFVKTAGVEKLTGDFRSSFKPDAVTQTRADMDEVLAMSDELQTKTLPALPDALGMTPDQFGAFMGSNYPDVANGLTQIDPILTRFDGLVGGVEAQAPNFREADTIPTSSLSSRTVPYLFLIPGALLIILGGVGLVRTRRDGGRAPVAILVATTVIGVGLAGGAVAFSVHAKGQAVDDMTSAFAPTFSEKGVAQAHADIGVIQKMAAQLETETIPGLAQALQMSPEEFGAFMTTNFPAVATGLADLDAILVKFDGFIAAIGDNLNSFNQAADLPTAGMPATSLFYWLLVPGVLVALLSGGLIGGARRRSEALEPAPRVAVHA